MISRITKITHSTFNLKTYLNKAVVRKACSLDSKENAEVGFILSLSNINAKTAFS